MLTSKDEEVIVIRNDIQRLMARFFILDNQQVAALFEQVREPSFGGDSDRDTANSIIEALIRQGEI